MNPKVSRGSPVDPFRKLEAFISLHQNLVRDIREAGRDRMEGDAPVGERPGREGQQSLAPARVENHRFWRLSALRAHTKSPYKMDFHRKMQRALNRPGTAWTVGSRCWPAARSSRQRRRRRGHPATRPACYT